jgi:hypothetical protein
VSIGQYLRPPALSDSHHHAVEEEIGKIRCDLFILNTSKLVQTANWVPKTNLLSCVGNNTGLHGIRYGRSRIFPRLV